MAYTTINKSTEHFNTKLYTGTGSSNSLTGVGFQPDFTWIKRRSAASSNQLFDAVRGVTKRVFSDTNEAESTDATTLTSFDTDGFTVSTHTGLNNSSDTYASWNWKANGQGSSNTDGSINTTYTSANTTSGMSIIQYSGNGTAGATIGHGLGVAPKCVIIKRTDTTSNWIFGTGAIGFTKFLYLNTTDAETTNSGTFNNTAPSSSVITLGSWNDVNNSSGTYIAYCFAEKTGFSKFGSYVGANSNQFIYLGFKPAMVIIKNTSISENWSIYDNKRLGYNPAHNRLYPNLNNAEATETKIDFVSNGMMLRSAGDGHLTGGTNTFIYMAFAEAPLVGSNNVPCTAR